MDAGRELAIVIFIVLVPTVPAAIYLAAVASRRRRRLLDGRDGVVGGRIPETPFLLIATVGAVAAAATFVGVLVTLAARAIA